MYVVCEPGATETDTLERQVREGFDILSEGFDKRSKKTHTTKKEEKKRRQ